MAWNEPGGSGGRDPWGGRNNEQGPPDLDEVVRKLQTRFKGIFGGRGGKSGGGGGASGGGVGAASLGVVLVLALVVWGLSGFYIVEEGKRAVVLRFGDYQSTTGPGLHWYPRFIDKMERVDVDSIRSIELGYRADEALMLTQDENIIDIKFAVQYRVGDPKEYLFNVRDPDETLRQSLESAVREIVGKSKMDFIITGGRSEIVVRAQKLLQEILDDYGAGLIVTTLNMQDAQAPEQVQDAFADAVKAREDEVRLKNEAEAYSNDILPRARGGAARIIEEANAYREQVIARAEGETARFTNVLAEYTKAPEVMRKRLYLDTMESVLSNSSKIMIDSKDSNNLMYLPIDKMMQRGITAGDQSSPESGVTRTLGSRDNSGSQPSSNVRDNLRSREVRR
ncbi:FtsH protease activity modulator HflK [Thiohalomonas denitrificans]|uniref:FtsH protease activity modulator HflK n=1 Tax=Thiohalomonas denitrificans TaxID=415747 RepID=UPI0026ED83A3|nr:FtsH protease activity modulator HflK [Thiohalomonas denitrificans]